MKKFVWLILGVGVVLISVGVYFLFKDEEVVYVDEFLNAYTEVNSGHKFSITGINDVINILENGSGVVFIGFPECKWCQAYAPILDEVGRELNINTIYYLDIREDRADNSSEYLKIVEILKEYLELDDEGNPRIYVPTVVGVIDGEIVGFDDETSLDTGGFTETSDYWSDEEVSELKENLRLFMSDVVDSGCSSCDF